MHGNELKKLKVAIKTNELGKPKVAHHVNELSNLIKTIAKNEQIKGVLKCKHYIK